MILDPAGEVIVESHELDDDVVVGLLTTEAFVRAPGRRYLRARRPELYGKLTEPHPTGHAPVTSPGWKLAYEKTVDAISAEDTIAPHGGPDRAKSCLRPHSSESRR